MVINILTCTNCKKAFIGIDFAYCPHCGTPLTVEVKAFITDFDYIEKQYSVYTDWGI